MLASRPARRSRSRRAARYFRHPTAIVESRRVGPDALEAIRRMGVRRTIDALADFKKAV